MNQKKTSDFKSGDGVKYIPNHADGDPNHKDCENGVVSSINEHFVFVKYIRNNMLNTTAAATKPENLIHLNK